VKLRFLSEGRVFFYGGEEYHVVYRTPDAVLVAPPSWKPMEALNPDTDVWVPSIPFKIVGLGHKILVDGVEYLKISETQAVRTFEPEEKVMM
jgi:hypothetical protein